MANIQITQLPTASSITGTEAVPIVQNGVTVQTTTGAIAASPSQPYTYLTVNQTPQLANSRALSSGTGIGLVDSGAQSTLQIRLNGASGSLESAGNGVIVKTGSSTVVPRTLTATGSGISITDGSGVSGNPTFALSGLALALANMSGTSMLAVVGGSSIAGRQITGTANQIDVANGNGAGNPTISIADNAVFPGVAGVVIPNGTTAEQPVGTYGQIRYNSDTDTFDGFSVTGWNSFSQAGGVSTFSAGSTGLTPSSATTGAVTLGGVLNVASGGTGVTSSTGSGSVVLDTSPTLVTPILGTPQSGNFSTGTFTWPTFNQNTSGTAAGLSATLVIASGGTNSTSTPTAGGAAYGTGTAYAFTAQGTAGQVLTSNGASAPTWSGISGGTF